MQDNQDKKNKCGWSTKRQKKNTKEIPVEARVSAPVQTGSGAHLVSCTVDAWSLAPGVKRPGRVVNHPPPSSAEVKERVELYFYFPSGPSWPVLRLRLPFLTCCIKQEDEPAQTAYQNSCVRFNPWELGLPSFPQPPHWLSITQFTIK